MNETTRKSESFGTTTQLHIYQAGLRQEYPALPVAMERLEQAAEGRMSPGAFGYVAGGAGSEDTMRANLDAFKRWRIVPRMLRDVSQRSLKVELLGIQMPAPLMLAPIGVQSIIHPEAELPAARAAAKLGIPVITSTVSSVSMEDIAETLGDTPRWFQLYWGKDPELVASFLRRAENAGYSALVVTLDTPLLGWRERDIERAYLPFLNGEGITNYVNDPVFCQALGRSPQEDREGAIRHFLKVFSHAGYTFSDLAFLREHTRLPILLKGILHPDDARQALDHGVSGIVVSNHGGRQVDGAIAALDALPAVVDAVQDRVPILFDSGVRRGADAFKAIALGAKVVLLGRPYLYGLALGGEEGVRQVLQNFLADLDLTLALSGHTCIDDIKPDNLVSEKP